MYKCPCGETFWSIVYAWVHSQIVHRFAHMQGLPGGA